LLTVPSESAALVLMATVAGAVKVEPAVGAVILTEGGMFAGIGSSAATNLSPA
jgi:hypothetical protein